MLLFAILLCLAAADSSVRPAGKILSLGSADSAESALLASAAVLNTPAGPTSGLISAINTWGDQGTTLCDGTSFSFIQDSWKLSPTQKSELESLLQILLSSASEVEYVGQVFEINMGTSASTLSNAIVVAKRVSDSTFDVGYAFTITSASLVQLTRSVQYKSCHHVLFVKKCSWKTRQEPRGMTVDEALRVKTALQASAYSFISSKVSAGNIDIDQEDDEPAVPEDAPDAVEDIVRSWVESNSTQAVVSQNYDPSSPLGMLQSSLSKIQQSTSSLRLESVAMDNVLKATTSLLSIHGITDVPSLASFASHNTSSFEFFTGKQVSDKESEMSYVWVLIARQATSRHGMYDIYFLSSKLDLDLGLNFTERALAMREAYPAPNGNFSYQEDIPVAKNIPVNSTDLSNVMDMLRFTTSSVLLNADEQVNPSDDDTLLVHQPTHRLKYTRDIAAGLAALEGALKGAAATWGTVVQNFKSSSNQSIKRIIQLGFSHFAESSTILKAEGIPADKADDYFEKLKDFLAVPAQNASEAAEYEAALFALEYAEKTTWLRDSITYADSEGAANSAYVLKYTDPDTQAVTVYVAKITTQFGIAPDVLLVTSDKSILGGIWSSSKTKIQHIPHDLTLQDTVILQDFFRISALGKLMSDFGLSPSYPSIPGFNSTV